ncbi:PREDICTED: translin-associated factor X-interacting protein 1-like [Branchiostoma belcheri]|uniref:Translin-associated factor X-interacting protein 1-like n=1 Tax=Branchiostoma belcheri TaxID=7741 RepID=A0A6P5A909_BRABE|nr:PREDICTED: translin-associated factor X-interacting protein 1-like [Branchiostoma belcheri]
MAAQRVAKLPPLAVGASDMSPRAMKGYEGLTGPSYQLVSTGSKYSLPSPGVLQPYVDTRSGALDAWPAHAAGQTTSSTALVPHAGASVKSYSSRKPVVKEEDTGKGVPKPKFLDQLENFLKKELRALGCPDSGPSELRLQAHREVFEYLIEDFKTYKPLLSSIKNEYETMLAHLRQQIRDLEPLKSMLVTVSEQCDQKILKIREQEKQEMVDLRRENTGLYRKIMGMSEQQQNLQAQVNKLREELSEQYLRYRDECDARKLLVSDINDLRYQAEDLQKAASAGSVGDPQDDPVMMRVALKQARVDLKKMSEELIRMKADYGDVVPRRDFEMLEAKHNALLETEGVLRDQFSKLQQEHDTLLEVHKQVLQQRDEFYTQSETLRRSATPRPDWDKCGEVVDGGSERWAELTKESTSDQKMDILLQELQTMKDAASDKDIPEFFEGRGFKPDVPAYLRYEGQVRNRKLAKRDLAIVIKDVWREKAAHDAGKAKPTKLENYLLMYLEKRFNLEPLVAEWGYNIHDACTRFHQSENSINLFFSILKGETDEGIYHQQIDVLSRLLSHFAQKDVTLGTQGNLPKEEFSAGLVEFFPLKEPESVQVLVQAAEDELDTQGGPIPFKQLFTEDDEGRTGPFINRLRDQTKSEREAYVDDIQAALGDVSDVVVEDVRKAFLTADPEIDQPEIDMFLGRAFGVDKDKLEKAKQTHTTKVLQRLRTGNIHRVGKKP